MVTTHVPNDSAIADSKSALLPHSSPRVQKTADAVATLEVTGSRDQQEEQINDIEYLMTEETKKIRDFNLGIGNPDRTASEEPHTLAIGSDKKYFKYDSPGGAMWFKRNLTPPEFTRHLITGEPNGNHMAYERLKNEAAALKFIGENTNIPIPVVRAAFEDNGRFYLFTEEVKGVEMNRIPEEQRPLVFKEIEEHIQTLRSFKSNQMGGLAGDVCLPYRVGYLEPGFEGLKFRPSDEEEFVFCHNDIAQQNIFVDPDTLKITAIIDWEFAGYYPPQFEGRFYKREGPSYPMEGEVDDAEKLREIVTKWVIRDCDA